MADPALALCPVSGIWDDVPDGLYVLSFKQGKTYGAVSGPRGRALACFDGYEIAVEAELVARGIYGRKGSVELRSFNDCVDLARGRGCQHLAIWRKVGAKPQDWFDVDKA